MMTAISQGGTAAAVPGKKVINHDLEILRGFAGVFVIFAHMFDPQVHQHFDAGYYRGVLSYLTAPAHFAVLIFFVLSGYVIGVSNKKPLEGKDIGLYIKKRLVRLYPIYLIAITLGLWVTAEHYSIGRIIANYTLTQNIVYQVFWPSNPAWSLNYEMLFYLLFIPLSYFRINPIIAWIVCLVIGFVNTWLPYNSIITSYAFGFAFWLTGLIIARYFKPGEGRLTVIPLLLYMWAAGDIVLKHSYYNLSSILYHIKPFTSKLNDFWAQSMLVMLDLNALPFAFFIVLFFSGKTFKYRNALFIILQLFIVLNLYVYYKHSAADGHVEEDVFMLILAGVLMMIRVPDAWVKRFGIYLGSLSYGMYIIHYPIFMLFSYLVVPDHSGLLYAVKVASFYAVVWGAAVLLEQKMQPKIRDYFFPKAIK